MKDYFSEVSDQYSRFRPKYPQEVFDLLRAEVNCFDTAWDCGTGNGQVALPLSEIFKTVHATDISASQLLNAPSRDNIIYSKQPAEQTNFKSEIFDLITVAQAIHWFDFDKFYTEVNRTLKKDGLLAVMGYGLLNTNEQTQVLIHHLYYDILSVHWDPERKFIDQNYTTIPFPFHELHVPSFSSTIVWSIQQLIGYLKTWSAVQHFIKEEGYDPVDKLTPGFKKAFGIKNEVSFPILLRVGKK